MYGMLFIQMNLFRKKHQALNVFEFSVPNMILIIIYTSNIIIERQCACSVWIGCCLRPVAAAAVV